ncbi:TPA: hypothetical protein R1906_002550, partial [Staphylococcus delphini]|nr:hypothetical protein [Staphylococcus delphini]
SILLLMLIDFPILEAMSTCLLTPIGFSLLIAISLRLLTSIFEVMSTYLLISTDFLLLIVTSLYLPTSIDLSIPMLILPHSLICSSMLMLIGFPTL